MASFRRIGKKWHAEVRIKGKAARKTLPTKIEAQSWTVEKLDVSRIYTVPIIRYNIL